jgi:YidC/Oxa1 family membrane protein insertase
VNLWNAILIQPLTTALLFLYTLMGGNLGLAIIVLTVGLRVLLFPLSFPSLQAANKQRMLKPKIDEIKKRYKGNREKIGNAQMELFRKEGINPFAGCLPQILQLVVLIAIYTVFREVLANGSLNTQFLVWDLAQPDHYFIIPILAAGSQFLMSRQMNALVSGEEKSAAATTEQTDDFAAALQKQNLYIFPLMTLIFGLSFSSGLMLYWFISSLLQMGQQWVFTKRSANNGN